MPRPEAAEDEPSGAEFAGNLIGFARLLRRAGLPVGPAESLAAAEAFLAAGQPLAVSLGWGAGELPGAPLKTSDGHRLYPAFQFDRHGAGIPRLREVLAVWPEEKQHGPWQAAAWLNAAGDDLDGMTPA